MSGDKVVCEDCVTGFLKTGETKGDIKTLGSAQAYFTPSSSHKSDKAIVIIGDIFGWEFINTRLYADEIARYSLLFFFKYGGWSEVLSRVLRFYKQTNRLSGGCTRCDEGLCCSC